LSLNEVTSEPSEIPVVTGAASESTVHSLKVAVALPFEQRLRIGVSSGASKLNSLLRSSRFDTAEPVLVLPVGAFGEYVFEIGIILFL
jgi:hypothetical protein